MAEEATQMSTGKVFFDPGIGTGFTQFFPGGGVDPDGRWMPINLDPNGSTITVPDMASNAKLSVVPASIASVQVLPANPNRKGFLCVNNSSSVSYLSYAAASSNILYTEILEPGSSFSMDAPIYTGAISVIWESVNGQLQVTELS